MNIKEVLMRDGISLETIGDIGEISDGYHTFNSLYFQRCVLFAALCNTFNDLSWKSRRHANGEDCFGGGYFIVGIDTPKGPYTYHYENKYWDMFKCKELSVAREWDGHTDKDVERLLSLCEEPESQMKSWAESEIELACEKERESEDWDYGCACYESALRAFKSLTKDGHTGMSISITKHILNRLIEGKPLTPIEDTEDVWNEITDDDNENRKMYQCKRMYSLFKYVYKDGTVKYSDCDSSYCIDVNNPTNIYNSGLVRGIIEKMFPIVMPYSPGAPIKVYCEEFLTDKANGDFDTVGVLYAIKPDGEKVEINRFFKEAEKEEDGSWLEIDKAEYDERKSIKI